jgi:uncharacterized protein
VSNMQAYNVLSLFAGTLLAFSSACASRSSPDRVRGTETSSVTAAEVPPGSGLPSARTKPEDIENPSQKRERAKTSLFNEGDRLSAFKLYREAAEKGDAQAQFALSYFYRAGLALEVPQDEGEAFLWMKRAAEAGYDEAELELGNMYGTGVGTNKDLVKAFVWIRKAAVKGNAGAQHNLASLFINGYGVPQNYTEGLKWLKQAAAGGHTQAKVEVGRCYANGRGVPVDKAKAMNWYRAAAADGNTEAMCLLGGDYILQKNHTEAVKWFRLAAERNDAFAQKFLAVGYEAGQGVAQDWIEAYKWFSLSAAQGDDDAVARRNRLLLRMTAEQIAEGQRRASEFLSSLPEK